MKKTTTLALLTIASSVAFAQNKAALPQGREMIDKLCGCFNVEFKYAETFSPDKDYKFHDKEKITGVTELALPIEVSDKRVSIQHILMVSDSFAIKHWREDWVYESNEIWKYSEGNTWTKAKVPAAEVKGKWVQTVWEVSDAPRYQGYSQFVPIDGTVLWQNTTDAPLPRREYSVRSDYNILNRTNRLSINDNGYLHEQDNKKIIREKGIDKLLAEEKGYNTYKRLADNKCEVAKAYWEKNKPFWIKVKAAWDNYFAANNSIGLKATDENGKPLNSLLSKLEIAYTEKEISDKEIGAKIKEAIDKFIINGKDVAIEKK